MSAVAESSLDLLVNKDLGAVISSLFVQIPVPVSHSRSHFPFPFLSRSHSHPVSRSLLFQLPHFTSLVPRPLPRKAERGSGVLSDISCHMGWGRTV